jgi:hypothetical protein
MKKQLKNRPASIKSMARAIMRKNKDALPDLLKALAGEGLPEHDSPFKLYFDGKLVGSAGARIPTETTKSNDDESN